MFVGLPSALAASAETSIVQDGASYFSEAGIRQAEEAADQLRQQSDNGPTKPLLLIHTIRVVPPDRLGELKSLRSARFFTLWAEEQAERAGAEGIYVLICQEPDFIQVHVTPETAWFSRRNAEELRRLLVRQFNKKQYDDGLRDAVEFVREKYEARRTDSSRSDWLWVGGIIAGILMLWLLLSVIRRRLPELGPENEAAQLPEERLTESHRAPAEPTAQYHDEPTLSYHRAEESPDA
jgi:hypothetical protein